MGFANPLPGKEKELGDRMRTFAEFMRQQPGLIQTHVLTEKEGNTLLGISMWESVESFNQAMKNLELRRPTSGSAEVLRPNPPVVRQFFEI
jgi:heme-degrading monooxygenase HmoA